jgi:hypothetical protein
MGLFKQITHKTILSLFTGLFLFSCTTTKKLFTRAGDTVTIEIPNIKYKDTTITKINYDTRTIARVNYDSQGNKSVDCISAEVKELIEILRNEKKTDIKETEDKEHSFKPQYIFYAIGFLVLMVVIGLVVVSVLFSKMKASIPSIISKTIRNG